MPRKTWFEKLPEDQQAHCLEAREFAIKNDAPLEPLARNIIRKFQTKAAVRTIVYWLASARD